MPKKQPYARRRKETTRDERAKAQSRHLALTNKRDLTSDLKAGIRLFNEARGLDDEDNSWNQAGKKKREPRNQTPLEPKPLIINRWVSRGVQPGLPPRYHAKHDEMVRLSVLTDAREIVAVAKARGLVSGGGVDHKNIQ